MATPIFIPSLHARKTSAPRIPEDAPPKNRRSEPPLPPRIAVIGGASVDLYLIGCDEWPEIGERLDLDAVEYHPGGNGLNVAISIAKLGGVRVDLYTAFGSGPLSNFLDRATKEANPRSSVEQRKFLERAISLRCASAPQGIGPTLSIVKLTDREPCFIRAPGAIEHLSVQHLENHFTSLAKAKIVFLAGLGLTHGLDPYLLRNLLERLRTANSEMKIIADVALLSARSRGTRDLVSEISAILTFVDYFIPNEQESLQYSGANDQTAAAKQFFDRGVREAVIIKRAQNGVNLHPKGRGFIHIPAYTDNGSSTSVLDTTGAGDTWGAGFVASLVHGRIVEEACKIGNAVAAFCIRQRGATTNIHKFSFYNTWIELNANDRFPLQ